MKKIGYIIAAAYAVFSLSVTSFALPELIQGAEDAVDTAASEAEDILGGGGSSDAQTDDPTESGADTSADDPADSSGSTADDPADSSDTTADNPADSSGTSADVTTTIPKNVGNAGNTNNPATGAGAVLGFTALGMAAAGLTAAAARKRK